MGGGSGNIFTPWQKETHKKKPLILLLATVCEDMIAGVEQPFCNYEDTKPIQNDRMKVKNLGPWWHQSTAEFINVSIILLPPSLIYSKLLFRWQIISLFTLLLPEWRKFRSWLTGLKGNRIVRGRKESREKVSIIQHLQYTEHLLHVRDCFLYILNFNSLIFTTIRKHYHANFAKEKVESQKS